MPGRTLSLAVLVVAALGLGALALRSGAFSQPSNEPVGAAPTPWPAPTFLPTPEPTLLVLPTTSPVPSAGGPASSGPTPTPVPLTLDEEFNGSGIPAGWTRSWIRIGDTQWSHAQSVVANGMLTITARRTATGWVSDELDTLTSFTQKYGHFSARIKAPAGRGLWPTFWIAQGWRTSHAEIDIMEICANPPGTHGGNDQTILHTFVHSPSGFHLVAEDTAIADLTGQWHVYELDWRPDHLVVSVDGVEVYRTTDPAKIPDVRMAVVIDLAVGGWCGDPDSTTPNPSKLFVDWIRVSK